MIHLTKWNFLTLSILALRRPAAIKRDNSASSSSVPIPKDAAIEDNITLHDHGEHAIHLFGYNNSQVSMYKLNKSPLVGLQELRISENSIFAHNIYHNRTQESILQQILLNIKNLYYTPGQQSKTTWRTEENKELPTALKNPA